MPATTPTPLAPAAVPTRRAWTRPTVDCRETRPEITAYAGDSVPWNNR